MSFAFLFIVLTESTIQENIAKPNNTSVNQAIANTTVATIVVPSVQPLVTKVSTTSTSTAPPEITRTNQPENSTDSSENGPKIDWSEVDIVDEQNNRTLTSNNITQIDEDFHEYYNSTVIQDEQSTNLHQQSIFADCTNLVVNKLLSKSHRRAMTLKLPFEFPFYGHPISNITIATGGFLYAGDYIHSWLAATQYISPLMANFDTSLSNDSYVKYCEDGE